MKLATCKIRGGDQREAERHTAYVVCVLPILSAGMLMSQCKELPSVPHP